jgi:hypothetical protein
MNWAECEVIQPAKTLIDPRDSREGGNPCAAQWMPAFAGMTGKGQL